MKLNPPFVKTNVLAGDPVTAQAWNDIVDALAAVYSFIEASEAPSVKVQIANAGIDLASVRVTATRGDDGAVTDAADPVPPSTLHIFSGLKPGTYTLRAEAPGFDPAAQPLVVPTSGTIATQTMTLSRKGAFMPLTFGLPLQKALDQLTALTIAVNNIVDVTGTVVPPAKPEQRFLDSLVLMQFPLAGTPVAPGQFAQLVISAAPQVQPVIEMPSLTGLTLAEATKALEALGLKVGTSVTALPSPPPPPPRPGPPAV